MENKMEKKHGETDYTALFTPDPDDYLFPDCEWIVNDQDKEEYKPLNFND